MQSSFEAQEVELLAVAELPAGLEIVFQRCIEVCPVFVHGVLLVSSVVPSRGPRRNLCWQNRHRSRGGLCDKRFDLGYFFIREAKLASPHDPLCLARVAGADDGSCYGWIMQRPSDCDFSG